MKKTHLVCLALGLVVHCVNHCIGASNTTIQPPPRDGRIILGILNEVVQGFAQYEQQKMMQLRWQQQQNQQAQFQKLMADQQRRAEQQRQQAEDFERTIGMATSSTRNRMANASSNKWLPKKTNDELPLKNGNEKLANALSRELAFGGIAGAGVGGLYGGSQGAAIGSQYGQKDRSERR